MLKILYRLKALINPSLKIWGIYCFVAFATPLYAQETPQQRLAKFFKGHHKPADVPNDLECFQRADYNILKINDNNCLANYFEAIEKTGLFSTGYIQRTKTEIAEIQSSFSKLDSTQRQIGGILYSEPSTADQLLYALENSSSTKIDKTKAKVTVNFRKPYKQTLIYNFDLEENTWKISSIEFKK